MPKVSIVIPVYEMEEHLRKCLDSVAGQTLKDIEILCVNDASPDNSLSILRAAEKKDPRFKVIDFPKNRGTSDARKAGVAASSGEAVMFLDPDDTLEPSACEKLYNFLTRNNVDMVLFGVQVVNRGGVPESRVNWVRKFLGVPSVEGVRENPFRECFLKKTFSYNLWSKIYRGDLCRAAFAKLEDGYFPKAQDLYAFFAVAFFAKTWTVFPETLYNYSFGTGITGRKTLTPEQYDRHCHQAYVAEAIGRFAGTVRTEENGKELDKAVEERRSGLRSECLNLLFRSFRTEEGQRGALGIFVKRWGFDQLIRGLSEPYFYRREELVNRLHLFELLPEPPRPRKIRTVAFYYLHLTTGGVQRVITLLIPVFLKLGCRVVVLTDTPPTPGDFPLPDGVKRIVLPAAAKCTAKTYAVRMEAIRSVVEKEKIDLFYSHSFTSNVLLWDLLTCRWLCGIPFLVHVHSVFLSMLAFGSALPEICYVPKVLAKCSGAIVLSGFDEKLLRMLGVDACCLPNPVTAIEPAEEESPAEAPVHTLVWCGRFASEKRPLDAAKIFAGVKERIPDAKFIMLGDGFPGLRENIRSFFEENGILDSVEMCGFQPDVIPFYRRANVMISTSRFEGSPMAVQEAKMLGLPVVAYDMPYLETFRGENPGSITVPQEDVGRAAEAVAELFKNPERLAKLSAQARTRAMSYANFDQVDAWSNVLARIESGRRNASPAGETLSAEESGILFETFADLYKIGLQLRHDRISSLEKELGGWKSLSGKEDSSEPESIPLLKKKVRRLKHLLLKEQEKNRERTSGKSLIRKVLNRFGRLKARLKKVLFDEPPIPAKAKGKIGKKGKGKGKKK